MTKKLFILVGAILIAVACSGTGTTDADETEATLTLCELYERFRALEEAYGTLADVVDGIRCQEEELECSTEISFSEDEESDKPERGKPRDNLIEIQCHKNPCPASKKEIAAMAQKAEEIGVNSNSALNALLERVDSDIIHFITRPN